ncbi:MAG: tetratricopeptide repeat protein [Planctomycetes bacterium]|nr:tetratricopeptide repeat protein [Planctomycetota bacterium]
MGAAACVGLVIGGVVWFSGKTDLARPHEQAGPPMSTSVTPTLKVDALKEEIQAARQDIPIAVLKAEQLELGRRLMHEFPDSERPLVLMGHVYEGHGNTSKAIEFWQKALEVNLKRADVCNSIAAVEMGRGRCEEAITYWRKALENAAHAPKLRSDIALALMVLGRQAEAMVELARELEVNPQSGLAHFLLGKVCLQQKEYARAKAHFTAAIKLKPKDSGAFYGLVTACRRLGQQTEAAEHAVVFKQLKSEEQATEEMLDQTYDDGVLTRRRLAEIFIRAGEIYLAAGQSDKAEGLLVRAVTCDPANMESLLRLASWYMSTDQFSKALVMYKQLAAIEPASREYGSKVGTLSVRVKQIDDAEAVFNASVASAPLSSSAYRILARFYLGERMHLPRARALAEKAVTLEPMAANYIVLGWACDSQGDKQGVLSAMQRAIELEPGNQHYRKAYDQFKKTN